MHEVRPVAAQKNSSSFHFNRESVPEFSKNLGNDANAAKFLKLTEKLYQLHISGSVNIDFNLPALTESFSGKRHQEITENLQF